MATIYWSNTTHRPGGGGEVVYWVEDGGGRRYLWMQVFPASGCYLQSILGSKLLNNVRIVCIHAFPNFYFNLGGKYSVIIWQGITDPYSVHVFHRQVSLRR